MHEGVDFPYLSTLKNHSLSVKSKLLPNIQNPEVLTYVSRCFEEYRGFPQAVQSISRLLQQRPNLHVFFVGQDCTAYGNPRSDNVPWSEWARENFPFPSNRTHWTGAISESHYHQILSISNVHLYLTVPFILSWSFLEALSAGIPMVCSNTPPVTEVIHHMQSGLIVDFFDIDEQVNAVNSVLDDPTLSNSLSQEALEIGRRYSCQASMAGWVTVLGL
nr:MULTISPECIES: glycosyltransferase [unclassified Synechococcus]